MITLYANPYGLSADGFYFEGSDEFQQKAKSLRDGYGQPVEEFQIEFIDGADIDAHLAEAWVLSQVNLSHFLEACENWDEEQKRRFIIAVGECGYSFDPAKDTPDGFDVDIYECDCMRELAESFVDEGLYGEIPDHLENYIDYDAIARDLAVQFSETQIAGVRLIYACG